METIEQYKQKIKELDEENQRLRMLLDLSLKRGSRMLVKVMCMIVIVNRTLLNGKLRINWPISFLGVPGMA